MRHRSDLIGLIVAPRLRFWCAIVMLPAYLLIEDLVPKFILAALFAVFAVLAGKKIRWGYFAVLITSITVFHLLAPWGRVLAQIGPLIITNGALRNGLIRSITLVGMVFLSVAAVRPELELPGVFGGLLGRTFLHFETIIDGKGQLSRKDFFSRLDALLLDRFDPRQTDFGLRKVEGTELDSPEIPQPQRFIGIVLAVLVTFVPWGLWFMARF